MSKAQRVVAFIMGFLLLYVALTFAILEFSSIKIILEGILFIMMISAGVGLFIYSIKE